MSLATLPLPPSHVDQIPQNLRRNAWHAIWRSLGQTCMTLGFSLRTRGYHNVPRTGPALLIANHESFLDPLVAGLATGRPIIYLARKTLFRHPVFAWFIRSLNAIPIDQEGLGKEGLKAIGQQLSMGKAVLVFPEGARTSDGVMHEFRPGVHLLLRRNPVPIVPVGIAGAYNAWPIWRKYPIPAWLPFPCTNHNAIGVSIGKPLAPEPFLELGREDALRMMFNVVHQEREHAEALRRKPATWHASQSSQPAGGR